MAEPYYSKEQVEALHRLREAAGGAEFDAAWTELVTAIRDEMLRGGDPHAEPAQELARRWKALLNRFTGGDAEIERLLYEAGEKFQARRHQSGAPVPDVLGFIRDAMRS